ncbi:MAG: sugar ABC transporter permease [Chloroflexi bacterium]|nr:sugar ABC transporter permease [Chloroflexota bacterium]
MVAAASGEAPRKTRHGLSVGAWREALQCYAFISPWVIGFLWLTLYPFFSSLYYSFTDYHVTAPAQWVGLENFRYMFLRDSIFWKSLWNTLYYVGLSVPLRVLFGLLLAVLLNQKIPAMSVFRTLYYLPSITPTVAASIVWLWLLKGDWGLINTALRGIGIKGPAWLADPAWAKPALILMSLWGVGGAMVIYLAGLQGIPRELYEAGEIDGTSALQGFWHITIPMLSPVIFFNLIMNVIGAFQVFTQAYVMTQGGPANATRFYMLRLYEQAFSAFSMGLASAMAWFLFLLMLVFTLIQFKYIGGRVHYEVETRR